MIESSDSYPFLLRGHVTTMANQNQLSNRERCSVVNEINWVELSTEEAVICRFGFVFNLPCNVTSSLCNLSLLLGPVQTPYFK